jgi:hypothetical protein
MRLCVLDYFRAGHLRKRLGGIARCAGKPDARLPAIFREYFTEDIGPFADICGQRGRRGYGGISFVPLSFDQPLLTRTTFHRSLDESLLFIWRQIACRLSSGFANTYSDGGGSQTCPVNLKVFAPHSREVTPIHDFCERSF